MDHYKFCMDKVGKDSGPEDEQSGEEGEEPVENIAQKFEEKLK